MNNNNKNATNLVFNILKIQHMYFEYVIISKNISSFFFVQLIAQCTSDPEGKISLEDFRRFVESS